MAISGVGNTLSVTAEDDNFADEPCGFETTSDGGIVETCCVECGEIMRLLESICRVVVDSVVKVIKYSICTLWASSIHM